ncbi:DNA replication/repair protein RecF [Flavisolibacter ginsenosidimutans]|uniref:DNA replication and repair protein RecF n=1 Tax=Flavisolibacter ginsenosidimutans TaxID=661481 RepID=A0A5B8UEP1_9BACT|nr:DNA replication and repair protein RecF [Flavisolibacter ginsenosidimutans]QEC55034.1 DNA replication/repair protein RecF [Flavisolibacter ginsenosidimutans]
MSLRLNSISLFQFKNYEHQTFQFTERVVGICGRNGVGKTNLLDAIHYLCFTKSYFSRTDAVNVHQGSQGFRLEGHFLLHGREEKAVCILRETGRKEFLLNDEAYTKFSKHIGRYPCVVIAPDDVELIIGGSEERRKFVDTLLAQLDPVYLQALINYTRILQQRNSFLRSLSDGFARDFSVLDVLDEQLWKEGSIVFEKRDAFLKGFLPIAQTKYEEISQQEEAVNLVYDSELHTVTMQELLKLTRQKDLVLQRTSGGVHRDDLLFQLCGQTFKSIASQGQRKSLLFALKLAEMEILKKEKGFSPLLLLDDVFEKLDEDRITNLLAQVCSDEDLQIFITDTNCGRLSQMLEKISQPLQLIKL